MTTSSSHSDETTISGPARDEAIRIHRTLFDGEPTEILLSRFANVSGMLDQNATPQEREEYWRALERVQDLEALELAARYRGRLPLLTRKLTAMAYLAETLPQYRHHFIKDRDDRSAAWGAIIWGGVRAVVLMARGLWQLRRVPRA